MTEEPKAAKPARIVRSNTRSNTDIKLQLSNSYPADFDQLAQLLHIVCLDARGRIPMDELAEKMGLAYRQVESLGSIAQAFGLIQRVTYKPSPLGQLIQTHDPFFDDLGTLWHLHYVISADPRHVVWNRIITLILPTRGIVTRDQLRVDLDDLRQWFSEDSIKKHVLKEVNTVLDAYTTQRFSRLAYMRLAGESYRLSYREPIPTLVLAASIVQYRTLQHPGATAVPVPELLTTINGPGVVFQLTEDRLRAALEELKNQPGFTVESRADLDQVRLADDLKAEDWMRRYYESR